MFCFSACISCTDSDIELVDRDRKQNEALIIQEERLSDLLNHLNVHKSMQPDEIHLGVKRGGNQAVLPNTMGIGC